MIYTVEDPLLLISHFNRVSPIILHWSAKAKPFGHTYNSHRASTLDWNWLPYSIYPRKAQPSQDIWYAPATLINQISIG